MILDNADDKLKLVKDRAPDSTKVKDILKIDNFIVEGAEKRKAFVNSLNQRRKNDEEMLKKIMQEYK